MEKEINICKECGTENEKEYIYCKNCGVKLEKENDAESKAYEEPVRDGYAAPNQGRSEENHGGYYQPNAGFGYDASSPHNAHIDAIEGIPYDEVVAYVGKKAPEICPKFQKMEISNSKTSWCWPAAILGYFLGPIGAAIWFFYRKMHKVAIILAAIGFAVLSLTTCLTYNDQLTSSIESIVEDPYSFNFGSFMEEVLESEDTANMMIAGFIENIVNVATCVIVGIFSYHWYKKDVVSKIHRYRASNVDLRYYRMGLLAIGGTSGGMLALGIVIFCVSSNIAEFIAFMVNSLF